MTVIEVIGKAGQLHYKKIKRIK